MQPKVTFLKDYRAPEFLIDTVHLSIDLYDDYVNVRSILTMQANPAVSKKNNPLVLNGEGLKLQAVLLNGRLLEEEDYSVDAQHLTIFSVPEYFTIETQVVIEPRSNTKLSGLYFSRGNFCTQCEAQGFRRITYYLDRPDVMARFTTVITADKDRYPILLSNGNLIDTKVLADNRHSVRWKDPSKKPCYLFALVAGSFDLLADNFITMSGKTIELKLYVEKGFRDQGRFALESLKRAMRWDEETFGREYDLNIYMIVAVTDFNAGAMENKGLNIFNTKYILADPKTATDEDYVAIENVIGHEYFHNWSGNRITCRDWFQITLKEGLTVFRDQLFSEDMTSRNVYRIKTINYLRATQFPEDAGPLAHPIRANSYLEIDNFYTATVYRKGAEVIGMLRTLLGTEVFRKAMDLYFSRYDGMAITTEDFLQAMADASKKNLKQFQLWYEQAGTPVLTVQGEYDPKKQTFLLKVHQSCPPTPEQPNKVPFHLPLAMGFLGEDGKELVTQLKQERTPVEGTRVLEVHKEAEVFEFVGLEKKPVPSLLRHFSAPVILRYPYTDEELLTLLMHDTDAFVRWESGQELLTRHLIKNIARLQKKENFALEPYIKTYFSHILTGSHEDADFDALLLQIPSLTYLLQNVPQCNLDALFTVRLSTEKALAIDFKTVWLSNYKAHQLKQYHYTPLDKGKRQLKNICLYYLTQTAEEDTVELAYQQFKTSQNMTDIWGALVALNQRDHTAREEALSAFYHHWHKQPLLVNKWFTLQATTKLPNTLEKVIQLTEHPAFDYKNPNNVYALIGAFGHNLVCFHAKTGLGYQFLTEQVLKLDRMNPQVAARMLQPLTQFQKLDHARQTLIYQELQRLAQAQLSKNVYEVVTKSLDFIRRLLG